MAWRLVASRQSATLSASASKRLGDDVALIDCLRFLYAAAFSFVPRPGSFGGAGFVGASGNGVPAGAPMGGSTCGAGGGGVNLPVRTISSTCGPSRVSY